MRLLKNLLDTLFTRMWYVEAKASVAVHLAPERCVGILASSTKPQIRNLEVRRLYKYGRRYFLRPTPGGFLLQTNHRVTWRPAKRTHPATTMHAYFEKRADQTYIRMRTRIHLMFLINALWVPLLFSIVVISLPWYSLIQIFLISALFTASFLTRRYQALLEAHDMLYFVETVLESVRIERPLFADQSSAHVVYETPSDFRQVWQNFEDELEA
ncbi:hypothetical protein MASR2M15_09590 [Anaerolineales bacterium]